MITRLLLLVALTVGMSGLGVPSASAAPITGSVTVSVDDMPQDSYQCPCEAGTVNFAVSTPDVLEYAYYTFEVRITDPSGSYVDSHTSSFEGVGGTWQWPVRLSPDWDEYGTYSVVATVKFYVDAGNVPDDIKVATDTFVFSGPAPQVVYVPETRTVERTGANWTSAQRTGSCTVAKDSGRYLDIDCDGRRGRAVVTWTIPVPADAYDVSTSWPYANVYGRKYVKRWTTRSGDEATVHVEVTAGKVRSYGFTLWSTGFWTAGPKITYTVDVPDYV